MPAQILTEFLHKCAIGPFDKHSNIEAKKRKEKQVILAMLILVFECFASFTIVSLKAMQMLKFIELFEE